MNKNKGLLWYAIFGNILTLVVRLLKSIHAFYLECGTFWFFIKAGITLVIAGLIIFLIQSFRKMLRNKYQGSWKFCLQSILTDSTKRTGHYE